MHKVFAVAVLIVLCGCPPTDGNEDPAVTRGRRAYMGTCIACHNVDPAIDGAIGPAVQGASKALLELKILKGAYPAGYQPKRATKVMPPQPAMGASIDDLATFLR